MGDVLSLFNLTMQSLLKAIRKFSQPINTEQARFYVIKSRIGTTAGTKFCVTCCCCMYTYNVCQRTLKYYRFTQQLTYKVYRVVQPTVVYFSVRVSKYIIVNMHVVLMCCSDGVVVSVFGCSIWQFGFDSLLLFLTGATCT